MTRLQHNTFIRKALFGAALLFCILTAAIVQAQPNPYNLPKMRYEPVIPVERHTATQVHVTQPVLHEPDLAATVLIPELKGIVFIDQVSKLKLISPEMAGIEFDSDRPFAVSRSTAFRRMVNKYIGQQFSLADLEQLRKEITRYYERCDMPVVGVFAPAQDVTAGTLQVVLIEGRVGRVLFQGNNWFDSGHMRSQMNTRSGRRIYESVLNEDLRWLNQNPFREVKVEMQPGTDDGRCDLVMRVEDDFPVRASVAYMDNGTRSTGIERLQFSLTHGNLWKRDHILNYGYNTTPDFEKVKVHSLSYMAPRRNRDNFSFFGYHGEMVPNYGNPLFTGKGKVWQTSVRYSELLGIESGKTKRREQRFALGFDFKETNSNLDFGGYRVSDTAAQVAQIVFGYTDVFARSNKGFFAIDANLYWSPGKFSKNNNDEAFQGLRYKSSARYVYGTVNLSAVRFLSRKWQWNSRLNTQWSSARLLPIEEFGLGGDGSIRGYDTYATNADSGWTFSNELATRYKRLGLNSVIQHIPPYRSVHKVDDEYQLYGFADIGGGWNKSAISGIEKKYEALYGAGVGFRYNFGPWIRIDAAYGWQLKDLDFQKNNDRAHVSIVFSR